MTDNTTGAKSAARARVRAFLDARVAHAASVKPNPRTLDDEIVRQPGALSITAEVKGSPLNIFMGPGTPLLASDLALLAEVNCPDD